MKYLLESDDWFKPKKINRNDDYFNILDLMLDIFDEYNINKLPDIDEYDALLNDFESSWYCYLIFDNDDGRGFNIDTNLSIGLNSVIPGLRRVLVDEYKEGDIIDGIVLFNTNIDVINSIDDIKGRADSMIDGQLSLEWTSIDNLNLKKTFDAIIKIG